MCDFGGLSKQVLDSLARGRRPPKVSAAMKAEDLVAENNVLSEGTPTSAKGLICSTERANIGDGLIPTLLWQSRSWNV